MKETQTTVKESDRGKKDTKNFGNRDSDSMNRIIKRNVYLRTEETKEEMETNV